MKPIRFLAALALAGLVAACSDNGADDYFTGYIEGKYVAVAPREMARIAALLATRGARVEQGQLVARLETEDVQRELEQAEAELTRARAVRGDLCRGKGGAGRAVRRAQLAEAKAGLTEGGRTMARKGEVFEDEVVAEASLDQAQAAFDRAEARVETMKREIAVQNLPAREKALDAAKARVEAQQAAVERARWKLEQRTVKAPAAGIVDEVLRRAGEIAGPDAPVLSLLPDGNRTLRFFVPEEMRAQIAPGMGVAISCDSCQDGLAARVSYVAAEAEYTPPVIYSVESRRKLVFMIEAELEGAARALNPGQPVSVHLMADGGKDGGQ